MLRLDMQRTASHAVLGTDMQSPATHALRNYATPCYEYLAQSCSDPICQAVFATHSADKQSFAKDVGF